VGCAAARAAAVLAVLAVRMALVCPADGVVSAGPWPCKECGFTPEPAMLAKARWRDARRCRGPESEIDAGLLALAIATIADARHRPR